MELFLLLYWCFYYAQDVNTPCTSVQIRYVVAVLTLWLKKVKECLPDIWKRTGVPLLPDSSSLQQELIHIIWTNAESPVGHFILEIIYYSIQ